MRITEQVGEKACQTDDNREGCAIASRAILGHVNRGFARELEGLGIAVNGDPANSPGPPCSVLPLAVVPSFRLPAAGSMPRRVSHEARVHLVQAARGSQSSHVLLRELPVEGDESAESAQPTAGFYNGRNVPAKTRPSTMMPLALDGSVLDSHREFLFIIFYVTSLRFHSASVWLHLFFPLVTRRVLLLRAMRRKSEESAKAKRVNSLFNPSIALFFVARVDAWGLETS